MEQEYENLFNDEELSEQLIQECITNLRWKAQEHEEQRQEEALASREAEKEIPLPAYMKVRGKGYLQYQESSCLPKPIGENVGLGRIGTNQNGYGPASVGQVTEIWYTIDDMILLTGEIATNELIGHPGSELLFKHVWDYVKVSLPLERKEDYAKEMVRTAITMYLESITKPRFRAVIFSDGEFKITVDDSHEDNYDRAMKFIV